MAAEKSNLPAKPKRKSPSKQKVEVPIDEALRACLDLEERFRSLEGPPDAPERRALWGELAGANVAAGRMHDAALCYLHAAWFSM